MPLLKSEVSGRKIQGDDCCTKKSIENPDFKNLEIRGKDTFEILRILYGEMKLSEATLTIQNLPSLLMLCKN